MINFYNYLNYLLIPILLPIRIITFIGVNALFLCIPKTYVTKYFKNFCLILSRDGQPWNAITQCGHARSLAHAQEPANCLPRTSK